MQWTDDDPREAEEARLDEAANRAYYLALYAAGRDRELCDAYCLRGWDVYRRDTGEIIEAGICSYTVETATEEEALPLVAAHILTQIDAGYLGC